MFQPRFRAEIQKLNDRNLNIWQFVKPVAIIPRITMIGWKKAELFISVYKYAAKINTRAHANKPAERVILYKYYIYKVNDTVESVKKSRRNIRNKKWAQEKNWTLGRSGTKKTLTYNIKEKKADGNESGAYLLKGLKTHFILLDLHLYARIFVTLPFRLKNDFRFSNRGPAIYEKNSDSFFGSLAR